MLPSKFDNVIIALSGGVDSSVAAALMAENYPNARGIYMQNWSESQSLSDPTNEPCYERDWKDALKVTDYLGIQLDRVNFESDYWIDVFEPMLAQYQSGSTPNPDIGCNRHIKFGTLTRWLDKKYGEGNYWLVTGHYARIMNRNPSTNSVSEPELWRAYYSQKDQSYYLSQILSKAMRALMLPIGHLTKPEVRAIGTALNLPTATKKDSQGICFVNNSQHGKFKNFLAHYLEETPGNIVTIDATTLEKKVWGRHKGLWSYTIGQKIGISMPQADPRFAGTWYVSDKREESNEIVIVRGRENKALYHNTVHVKDFKCLVGKPDIMEELSNSQPSNIFAQYRSLQDPIKVSQIKIGAEKQGTLSSVSVVFDSPQRAMAKGQFLCLYQDGRVIGSGPIDAVERKNL